MCALPRPGVGIEGGAIIKKVMAATATVTSVGAEDVNVLHDIAWETYCRLNDENFSPAVRMAFFQGALEIMTVSATHEYWGSNIEALVRVYASALGLDVTAFGSVTLRRKDLLAGLEPDKCFYFGPMATAMRGPRKLDLHVDPAPELAVEIDISRRSYSKLPLYAALGIREVWRFHQDEVELYELIDGSYRIIAASTLLPRITGAWLTKILGECSSMAWPAWEERIRVAAKST